MAGLQGVAFSRAVLSARFARWRAFLAGILLGQALLATSGTALAQGIDHAPFDALLKANVANGVVNYPGFQDSATFRKYVDDLGKPVALPTKPDQLVYYINAYNALAIQGILDGLSPTSVFGRARYFMLKEWPLNGRKITLYDLEHKLLRPLDEPRIHFAIVCASLSCPALRPEVYARAQLDAQLDDQAMRFVGDRSRNRFDAATRTAHLSEIFKWFDEDFASAGSVQKYIANFQADAGVAGGLAQDAYGIEWITYDWNLNGTPPRR